MLPNVLAAIPHSDPSPGSHIECSGLRPETVPQNKTTNKCHQGGPFVLSRRLCVASGVCFSSCVARDTIEGLNERRGGRDPREHIK